ncbi:hypothetical protein Tco_0550836 [Tanacetum coccineum]
MDFEGRPVVFMDNNTREKPQKGRPWEGSERKNIERQDSFPRPTRVILLLEDALRAKNVGATYQRLVDKVFESQIGRNLEAYIDDMVIKSMDKTDIMADI